MARSIDYWYNKMIVEKANHSELDVLNSTSVTAIYKLIFKIIAVVAYALDVLFDLHKAETEDIINSKEPGIIEWYDQIALEFQYGDTLVWKDKKWQYAVSDATKQIITHSATIEAGGIIYLKVKKSSGKLSPAELNAFKAYIKKRKFAGCKVNTISYAADKLSLKVKIWFNAQLIDSDGVLISDGTTKPVEDAITAYITNLPFNGTVNLTALNDKLQEAIGVEDTVITEAKAGVAIPLSIIVNNNYPTDSGWIVLATGLTEISYCDASGSVLNTVVI